MTQVQVQSTSGFSSHSGSQDALSPPPRTVNKLTPTPETPTSTTKKKSKDKWYYPREIADDLKDVEEIPEKFKQEALACGWEYARCVIPQYTNWKRYLAFVRVVVLAIVAEFRGELVDIAKDEVILGYSVQGLVDDMFLGTPGHEAMGRELRAFLLLTAEKSSRRRGSVLFHRYVDSLCVSARGWLRMRDTDALARLTFMAALTSNNFDDVYFDEEQMLVLAELGSVLYDAVAYHKHRAEGETHETFAYAGAHLRAESYRLYREVLWVLDVAWAHRPEYQCVVNFIRLIGGPIHMTMRRYRFVEDGLTIGNPETEHVVTQTRENFKLWNRVETERGRGRRGELMERDRYEHVLARKDTLLFEGLAELLESDDKCTACARREYYGAEVSGQFGGVELCERCGGEWREYLGSITQRTADAFPEIKHLIQ
jgi:hypothetical protein